MIRTTNFYFASVSFLLLGVYWFNLFQFILGVLGTVVLLILSFAVILYSYSSTIPKRKPVINKSGIEIKLHDFKATLRHICLADETEKNDCPRYPLIFSRLIDGALQNLIDLSFRDFIEVWLQDLTFNCDELLDQVKQDVWSAIQLIHERASKIDQTNLVACKLVDILTTHLERFRMCQIMQGTVVERTFNFSPHLVSEQSEIEYLRKICEVFILFFFPQGYGQAPMKNFLREIITYRVLKPTVDTITDSDYINQKILSYIEKQQLTEAIHSFACDYPESFEEFIALIKSTKDLDTLKHVRYNIVSEITQATTVQSLPSMQSSDFDGMLNGNHNTSDVNKTKRYIKQLTYVKNMCEKHMRSLGWDCYPVHEEEVIDALSTLDSKILPLSVILENELCRKFLSQFLEQAGSLDLIKYWIAVQDLQKAQKSQWHQLGNEIYYTYLRSPATEIKIDKEMKKRTENFLLGDSGPEIFYEIQELVERIIEEKYYSSFLLSEDYKNLLANFNVEDLDVELSDTKRTINGTAPDDLNLSVGEHSNHARSKLDLIQEKLNNKIQALQALSTSLKPESKVINILSKEVEWLQGEKRRLEAHLRHTEMWGEHLGHWRAEVQSADTPENGESPEFVLVIHMIEDEADETSISTGWVVLRKLVEFQELNRKLRQLCPNVRALELPSQPLKFFGKVDRSSLDKAKFQIQKYLNFVLEDERLNQSEALYAFLSPSSEHLKNSPVSPKKPKFSFATLFKSSSNGSGSDSRDKDEEDGGPLLLEENENSKSVIDGYFGPSKDPVAEPFYALLEEIFNLRGVFRWLRRSLITFVQLSYGRTISRQIRETVAWMFSEPMLCYYIQLLTKSFWPNGQLAIEVQERTNDDKLKTKEIARSQFLNSIPDILINLVGAQSAQRGFSQIFDSLQNSKINKQLFYDMFEVIMYEIFPELEDSK